MFINNILTVYTKLLERAKIVAESTFYSADLNRNGIIDCYEFVLLYRYIESKYFLNLKVIIKIQIF